jgi:hypothetical protein
MLAQAVLPVTLRRSLQRYALQDFRNTFPQLALKSLAVAPAEGLLTEAVLKHGARGAEPPPMTQAV